jgi:plasmid stability protein
MAQMTIRNLDDTAYARLKEQAKRNHRSLEAEARAILEGGTKSDRGVLLERIRERRNRMAAYYEGDVTADIRQERDSR